MANGSFLSELRKRKVVQAAAIYGAVAWGVTEVVVTKCARRREKLANWRDLMRAGLAWKSGFRAAE